MQLRRHYLSVILFLFLAAAPSHGSAASEAARVDQRDPKFSSRGDLLYFGEKPFSGIQFARFQNGALYRETRYLNGKKDGLEKQYSLSGGIRALYNYQNGKKDGEQKGWFEDGTKQFIYHYKSAVLDGEQIEWHPNGVVFREQYFVKGTEVDRKIFFDRGEIFTNYKKRNGRIYGINGGELCFDKKKDGEK